MKIAKFVILALVIARISIVSAQTNTIFDPGATMYLLLSGELNNCGNSLLDAGENCDDGNSNMGDGCSHSCRVEPGFSCSTPGPFDPKGQNIIQDPGFESGFPNSFWSPESDYNDDLPSLPLCSVGTCRTSILSYRGDWWVAFYGASGSPSISSIKQSIQIPVTATRLSLYVRGGNCSDNVYSETVDITLDSALVGQLTCNNNGYPYFLRSFTLDPFANGKTYELKIEMSTEEGVGFANFHIDNLSIYDNAPVLEPSVCTTL